MFLNRVDSHMTGVPFALEDALVGLDRPLLLIFKPGLAHPPPGTGDGLRERDMAELGVPVVGDSCQQGAS